MKKISTLFKALILILMTTTVAHSQTVFTGTKIKKKGQLNTAGVDKTISDYDFYEFDPSGLAKHVQKKRHGNIDFKLKLGKEYNWDITLMEKNLRSNDVTARILTNTGFKEVALGKTITYQGFLNSDPSTEIRMTIKEDYVSGFVVPKGSKGTYFHSAVGVTGIMDNKKLLVYDVNDALQNISCKLASPELAAQVENAVTKQKNPTEPICQITEIALIADVKFMNRNGGGTVQGTIDKMEEYINAVDLLYDTHGIDFRVSEFFVSDDAATEPWTDATTDGVFDDIVSEVINWCNEGGLKNGRDILTFWTGRSIGFAEAKWIVCSPPFYWIPDDGWGGGNVVEPWGNLTNEIWNINIQAHELGHNFGQYGHTGGSYIMNPAPPRTTGGQFWQQATINRIADTLASDFVNCLESCGPAIPNPKFTSSTKAICPGQSIDFTDQSQNEPTSLSWYFEGGTPETSTDANVTVTYANAGLYEVKLIATNAEGSDSLIETNYITVNTTGSLPLSEDFEGSFPPTGWSINNPDNGLAFEHNTNAGNGSSSCMIMNNADNSNEGEIDEIVLPPLDFSSAIAPEMTFDVGYTQFNAGSADQLRVYASEDCGSTWTEIWFKTHTDLETKVIAQGSSNAWVPSSASDWRLETIDLTAYAGKGSVSLKFQNTSGYGTRIWVDNVNVQNVLSVGQIEGLDRVSVYPNPSNGEITLEVASTVSELFTLEIKNTLGQIIVSKSLSINEGIWSQSIELPESSGIYLLHLKSDRGQLIRKVVRK